MSQEQPKQPQTKPQTPKPSTPESKSGFQKVTGTTVQVWKQVQPVLVAGVTKGLDVVIKLVEGGMKKLEDKSPPAPKTPADTLPSAVTLPPETANSGETPTVVVVTPTPPTPKASTAKSPPKAQTESIWRRLFVLVTTFLVWYRNAVGKVRTRLPQSVNQKLPNDTILSGALAALFIFLFWSTSVLSPGKPAEVVTVPPAEVPAPELTAPVEITAPPELTAPSPSQPVEIVPPPPPVLTPEQSLIAAIQKQVSEIVSDYAGGLIQSIQANFQTSLLTVKVTDDWYTFDVAKQDRVANDMWNRAQELDFTKLQITDAEGKLLARNPVVGSNMVILKRIGSS